MISPNFMRLNLAGVVRADSPPRLRLATSGLVAAALILGLAFYALLVGVGVAVGLSPIAVFLALAPYAPIAYLVIRFVRRENATDAYFWLLLSLLVVSWIVKSIFSVKLDAAVDVLVVLLLPVFVADAFGRFKRVQGAQIFIVVSVVFLLFSLFVSLAGRSTLMGAAFQFITNLKVFSLLALGVALFWSDRTERYFWIFVCSMAILHCVLLVLHVASPGIYFKIFSGAYSVSTGVSVMTKRFVGIFPHYSAAGYFFSLMAMLCFSKAYLSNPKYYLVSVLYVVFLFATMERAETAMLGVGAAIIWLTAGGREALYRRVFIVLIFGGIFLGLFVFFAGDSLAEEAARWGVIGHRRILQPRPTVYLDSFRLAAQYFPLGSGLGTFGSAGALKFDHSLYIELGYASYGWLYGGRTVLMDTYWPNFIAEIGWGGAFAMFGLLGSVVAHSFIRMIRSVDKDLTLFWALAFGSNFIVFFDSFVSNAYQDPAFILVPFALYGAALRREFKGVGAVQKVPR